MGVAQTLSLISSLGGVAKAASPAVSSATSAWNGLSTAGKLATGGIAAAGLAELAGTYMTSNNASSESSAMQQQGDLYLHEALLTADQTAEQGRQFQAEQKMNFVTSGVSLAGSPLIVLDDTSNKVRQEIEAIKARGQAQRDLSYARAAIAQREGRAGFLSGLVKTGTTVFNLYSSAKGGGVFDKTAKKAGA